MEVVVAIGDAFLSSAFDVLIDRLAPQGDLLKMFRKRKNDVELLKKLKLTLLGLQAVLTDAENKQASNQFVREWLNELRHAVDSAENLIEQVNYEALKLKVEGKHQNLAEKILKHCRFCNVCLGDHSFLNINEKLEKTIETLVNLQNQISDLGLQKHFGSTKQETRTPSTSLVDESDIFGREKEIKDLIDLLLSEDASGRNLTVVPIVGMGGAGKTTLAKAVYNDDKVKDRFPLTAWYCVSEAYDALRITKGLLQEIGSFDSKDDGNLNQLQVKLKENLKGKKFLVVLDDVWNDTYSEWDNLRNVFVQGDMGSKIIVTTRKASVAQMMCADRCAITVGNLSSEDSWSLFKRHSLENRDHPELEEIGKKIANKCKGLPLALKALAGVLRGKSEVDEWRNILRSEIWDQQTCWNGILPALMLSYNDLPPHLKRCFAFCAIYPKDYEFCKDQVIYLWIANGLVKQFCLGNKYFDELRSRSLFERVPESEWKSEGFVMHDLINDLAQTASSKHCIRLEENEGSADMLEQSRHMSYSMGEDGHFEKLKQLSKSEQLRTLLPTNVYYSPNHISKRVLHNILPRLTFLRALSLSSVNKELPNDLFIKLKILRFLDLSQTMIEKLPDSICVLYNLETLLLSSCQYLEELPLQMEKLINLRHVDITNTFGLKMPLHLSKLKSLQMLVGAKFLVGGSGGLRMEDLGEVHNLYGSLSVLELQNVADRREAVKAKMREKNHVDKLSLKWSEVRSAYDSQTEREILDELHPHTNIKQLEITGYRGAKFSNWVADPLFLKLVKLFLSNCKDCDSLPALGQLPCLKFLYIRGMHGIREVTEEFYGILSSKKPFNSLEKLEFTDMPEWKQWHVLGSGEFPKLEKLSIIMCPKLMGKLPENLSSLTELSISNTSLFDESQLLRSQFEGMNQIVELSIYCCNSVTSLPFSILPSSLKRISIGNCEKLKLEEAVGCSDMILEELKLREFDCIVDISPEFLPTARKLSVQSCHNLTRFLTPTSTEVLTIQNCENVEILSVAVDSAMTYLEIRNCEKLQEIRLFNLQVLKMSNCKKVVNGRKEWCLQRLTELEICHDGSDEEIQHWQLPCSISRLTIKNLKTLSSQVLKSLTSLQYLCVEGNIPSLVEQGVLPSSLSELHLGNNDELHSLHLSHLTSLIHLHIFHCHNLQSLSESALPSSLSELTISLCYKLQLLSESALPSSLSHLTISYCHNIQSLSESALPSSLSHLTISHCPNFQSLSESALPSSLSHLTISYCDNLQSLSESALPSSLSELEISHCPNLQSLPVKEMPSSLSTLDISRCPLLEPLLEFDKGKYWQNIAQIPILYINGECM
ncbi:putative disease resistance RPP13-like protein 1 isoform X2 [Solanum pennellii]|uniref:Disease resistance RPP13-like protein 1 isoform X1 n=1 Tax=Solanum pennellii TaxID=28526 RepID=A0ABM1UZ10_SOLPN|nr:putative disease resistance RPP13-like protein 1 isoform X1 [Solanum pennellii]XP_027768725.1 putative disease resistance RPP13-like protein 1 isoform X1 [Solanum pennellii]XP_027768726.1 putative disease resistance RPP13-like protein 1 isoform X2 [Solanum pennellii]XP_027768727.1 putative disease resistance RPP13-like protein 1 isoform X1 [Solanum pennellii]XP_027768728.1 putative disease resistance RPP13-like protein 1 isoform X2 [Solanum pennellii]